MKRIRLLFWCPIVNPGGGVRLLLQLVHSLADQPNIELIKLVVPEGSIDQHKSHLFSYTSIELCELTDQKKTSRLEAWLKNGRRIFGIRGTNRLKLFLLRLLIGEEEDWQKEQLSIISNDCDLIYVFWPHRQNFPKINKPVVCTFQDATFFEFPEILGGTETKAEWVRADEWLRNSAQVIAPSHAIKDAFLRHFGEYCNSFVVISNTILLTTPALMLHHKSSLLDRLPSNYIVYPANITSHKNHSNLLLAWSRFTQRSKYPLVLFGGGTEILNFKVPEWPNGWQPARLAGVVSRTGLEANKDFYALGYIDDINAIELIKHAMALIMPTMAEGGGGFPVEEALGYGVPVLCSDIPVIRELLEDRSARICWFDPECPDSIVNALNDLVQNFQVYKQSALNAIDDSRPTWEEISKQYIEVFLDVIHRNHGEPN